MKSASNKIEFEQDDFYLAMWWFQEAINIGKARVDADTTASGMARCFLDVLTQQQKE